MIHAEGGGPGIQRSIQRLLQRMLTSSDGIPKSRMRGLPAPLPAVLTALYSKAGSLETLTSSWHVFRKPEELEVRDGKLIFLTARGSAFEWACDLGSEDPQVFRFEGGRFSGERISLSEFLQVMVAWQLSQGAFRYRGAAPSGPSVTGRVLEREMTLTAKWRGLTAYTMPGAIVWEVGDSRREYFSAPDGMARCCARTKKILGVLTQTYGFVQEGPQDGENDSGQA